MFRWLRRRTKRCTICGRKLKKVELKERGVQKGEKFFIKIEPVMGNTCSDCSYVKWRN